MCQLKKDLFAKMKLHKAVVVRVMLKILLYSICIALFFLFFMKDQMEAYIKDRQSFTSRIVEDWNQEFPTITLCLNPGLKSSVSKGFGFNYSDDIFYHAFPNSTLIERYNLSSFILGQDFDIVVNGNTKLKVGINQFRIKRQKGPENVQGLLKPVRTYHFGTCYTMYPKFTAVHIPFAFSFKVSLNPKLSKEDIPENVLLYFTSNQTWVGITDQMWPQYTPSTVSQMFNQDFLELNLVERHLHFEKGQKDMMSCLQNLVLKTHCETKCHMLSSFDLPPCETISDFSCIKKNLSDMEETNCYKTKEALTYKIDQTEYKKYHGNNLSTEIYIAMFSHMKQIKEEIAVLSTADLIGSVGGSLGMFFGFSIISTILYCLKKCQLT